MRYRNQLRDCSGKQYTSVIVWITTDYTRCIVLWLISGDGRINEYDTKPLQQLYVVCLQILISGTRTALARPAPLDNQVNH